MQVAPTATFAHVVVFGAVSGSVTLTLVSGMLPVFVAVTRKVSTSPWVIVPLPSPSALPARILATVIFGLPTTGVLSALLIGPGTWVEVAEPVLLIVPAVTSAA